MVDADPLVLLHAERVRGALAARETLTAYLRGVIAERRRTPGHDLISALIAVEEEGEVLRESDLIVMLNLLLISGHETSSNLIGNGIPALLHHPEQLDQLRTRPQLIESAVEELLRWDSPVQLTAVPPPRRPLLAYHGLLAPRAAWRSAIVPPPSPADARAPAGGPSPRRWPWARLLHRVFGFDVLVCGRCGGPRRILGAVTEPDAVRRVLVALGLGAEPPPGRRVPAA